MGTATTSLQPRMRNPAVVIPEAMKAIQALIASTRQSDVPDATLGLVHLRASQINGCSFCVDSGSAVREYIDRTSRRELLDEVLDEELPKYSEALRRLGE
jgi:alkylhydroperoxidase family enzyme